MHSTAAWLLLVHSIPPKPAYFRAKVMRRLGQLGALALKRSAYLLPSSDETLEDLQWLRHEIETEGGEAWLVEGRFVGGLSDAGIREKFREARAADYRAVVADARTLAERAASGADPEDASIAAERRRLVRRLESIRALDFFDADGREEAEALMAALNRMAGKKQEAGSGPPGRDELRGRTWATRAGVKVDRMASAWVIRRFIDPAARFVFVDPHTPAPSGAVRFDMFEGEFTHEGNRCTFEVLLEAAGLTNDRALAGIGEMVHDLDLRDDRYQRPETAGLGALVAGLVSRFDDDSRRLAESTPIFDTFYASLGGRAASRTEEQQS